MNYFRVGDIYEFKGESRIHGLLATKKESGYTTFTYLKEYHEGSDKNNLLSKSSIEYHQRSQSLIVKILTSILGGDNPEGYFGFMVDEETAQQISPQLKFRFSLNKLNSNDLFQIGGTSLARSNELEHIIKHCQNFQLNRKRQVDLEDYA